MFSYLFSDWSIQNFGEILSQKFWIDQSEEREGKFKFQNWSNFGPKELEIGTRYLESNFSFVIHMSKRLFFEQTGQIWGGVKGPSGLRITFESERGSYFIFFSFWTESLVANFVDQFFMRRDESFWSEWQPSPTIFSSISICIFLTIFDFLQLDFNLFFFFSSYIF